MSTGLLSDASPRSHGHRTYKKKGKRKKKETEFRPVNRPRLSLFFYFSFFILFTDEVQTTILGLVRILPDTWGRSENLLWNDQLIYTILSYFFFFFFSIATKFKRKNKKKIWGSVVGKICSWHKGIRNVHFASGSIRP